MPIQSIHSSPAQPRPEQPASTGRSLPVAAGGSVTGEPKNAAVQPTVAQLKSTVDNINKILKQSNNALEFNMDADTKKLTVKLVDTETGDVIRQFPSEDMLAISRSIDRFQQGLLLKQKA
ncbi:MAG: flagellar protein FlaG [Nitrosomonadales bacterium]|nr:flagellar protein FlaG [Nitrosomonadales bacterium]